MSLTEAGYPRMHKLINPGGNMVRCEMVAVEKELSVLERNRTRSLRGRHWKSEAVTFETGSLSSCSVAGNLENTTGSDMVTLV